MMATTLRTVEAEPVAGWPDPAWAWQRVEAWADRRWASRDVTFVVEGPGAWVAPLWPTTITAVSEWRELAWEPATVDPSPLGGYALPHGTFRFVGVAGDDAQPPAAVLEAVARLVAYASEGNNAPGLAGVRSFRVGEVEVERENSTTAVSRGLFHSGAADLLRPYRRPR